MNTGNRKTNKSYKFVLNVFQKLDLKSSGKHFGLQKLFIYHTWKNIRQHYKNNKLKAITPTSNGEFELLDGSYPVSDIKDYIDHIIKKT